MRISDCSSDVCPSDLRLARKPDLQRMANKGMTAIAPDEIAAADRLAPLRACDLRAHPVAILLERLQLASIFNRMAEFGETLAQDSFGAGLGNEQGHTIGFFRRRRLDGETHYLALGLVMAAIGAIDALRRVVTASRRDPVDHTEVFKHLLSARDRKSTRLNSSH